MPLIKVEIKVPEIRKCIQEFTRNRIKAFGQMGDDVRTAFTETFNDLLKSEIELFLGSPDQKGNKRNGYHPGRDYTFKSLGTIRIHLPKDRHSKFKSKIIPSREKMDPRLKSDVAIMHLAGLSTRTLAMISKRLLGVEVNKNSVTSSLKTIKDEAEKWLTRPLESTYWALYIDGTNFKIQRRGSTLKEPSLVVLGLDEKDRKSILAIEPGSKEDVGSWRSVFKSLKCRGLKSDKVRIGIMDGLPGLERVFREEFPNSITARCWRHCLENVMNKVPNRFRAAFKQQIDDIMYASSEQSARKAFHQLKDLMGNDAGRAVGCLEKDLESLLVHYSFDRKYWRSLRTTNSIERVNKELKRRYKSMGSIGETNLTSLLAFTALRLEMGWRSKPVTSKIYQNLKYLKSNAIESTVAELGTVH